jgi:outer membrane receptor protein involved in Fe transport
VLGDLERIEVVKGPQGTLFGANSVGGVIRYVTRDPAMDEVRGEASVDFSNTNGGGWNQLKVSTLRRCGISQRPYR